MSDIALLMTGVLNTKQPSPPKKSEQPPVQLKNGVEKSTRGQLSQANLNARITPPEFLQSDGTPSSTPSVSTIGKEHTLKKIRKKALSKSYYLAQFKILNPVVINTSTAVNSHRQPKPAFVQVADKQLTTTQPDSDQNIMAKLGRINSPPLPTLVFGDSGVAVRVLQRLLLSNGYSIRIDGSFGAITEAAVKAFQNRRNLGADGVVGQKTWRELTTR
ncbi:peptidoglycan-binding domain-containing protein [Iningainema tapete]|uniref:Peptidoglycan-binding protein n=1 Tax=Iningainema tapete BLCC-T55 TaxID=2748662 RepID=A0A8J6XJK3_9CYAN|nr:peptidoglycan-binding protein [Iningainema tapete]MBD2777189.1 peptidoglycan-binding protein [Iningainema tapete BLCC-T55]